MLLARPVVLVETTVAVLAAPTLAIAAASCEDAIDLSESQLYLSDVGPWWTHHNIDTSFDDIANLNDSSEIEQLSVFKHLERASNIQQAIVVIVRQDAKGLEDSSSNLVIVVIVGVGCKAGRSLVWTMSARSRMKVA